MNFGKLNIAKIYFDDIFLEQIYLNKSYDISQLISLTEEYSKYLTINIVDLLELPKFEINIKKDYVVEDLQSLLKFKLNNKSLKIIRYLNVLCCLNEFNFGIVDDRIIKSEKKSILVNYTEIIANRNYIISKHFLINYFNNRNYLLCYFLGRDLIENVKLYLHFLRGAITEETTRYANGIALREIINDKVKNDIHNKLANENDSWNFDIKYIIKNNPSLRIWNKELSEIKGYNDLCDNYIHKNGFSKISAHIINMNNDVNLFDMWCNIIKFYFTITASYDGKSIASSDYMDYLENDEEPPEGCQCWVAPVFQNFIDSEYNKEEKNKIQNQSYMDIK